MVNRKLPILFHDNALPHVSQPALQKVNELSNKTLPHPSCSLGFCSTDFYLFKQLDNFPA
ncbi:hypothetical protein Angca_006065 [Angiostrongylus cantonensis]|nr:hypothetical protein Angca_006065 [Angiostrongylus cantonensis]